MSDEISGTCGSCQWWQTPHGDPYDQDINAPALLDSQGRKQWIGDDYQAFVVAPGVWGWCGKVEEFGPSAPSDRFYVIDGSEYKASLSTRSDFGCVEWEAKQEPEPCTTCGAPSVGEWTVTSLETGASETTRYCAEHTPPAVTPADYFAGCTTLDITRFGLGAPAAVAAGHGELHPTDEAAGTTNTTTRHNKGRRQ